MSFTSNIILKQALCLVLVLAFCPLIRSENIKLQLNSSAFANCLFIGEKIVFKPKSVVPKNITEIKGVVNDSFGKKILKKEINADEFQTNGWSWKPAQAGYYEVKFILKDRNGKIFDCVNVFEKKAYKWKDSKHHLVAQKKFKKNNLNIAVFPSKTRKPNDIPPQIGVSTGWKIYGKTGCSDLIKLSRILGFHFIRIHPVMWAQLEPKPGEYTWDKLDAFISNARKAGYNKFIGNVFGTPQWASNNPEKKFHIIWRYMAYAPKNMKYWTNFLEAVIKRYPFIKEWELWNEPHLPGQSCFWHESPEKFLELLKVGYETIKKVQPDSKVLLGGIGMRYLPFYDRIIKDGANKYYDELALHLGWGQEGSYIEPFNKIDRAYGAPTKPWMCSEWHSVLMSSGDIPLPSEKKIALNMILSFIDQINDGAKKITFFGITPTSSEPETLKFLKKNGQMAQAPCIFRGHPYLEPRFAVVAWRNFIDLFSGNKIECLGGYSFSNGRQHAIQMKSDAGLVLLVWNSEDKKITIDRKLAAAMSANSSLRDWEGRKIDSTSPLKINLLPEHMYYIVNPDLSSIKSWKKTDQVFSRQKGIVEVLHKIRGTYRSDRLWDKKMTLHSPETVNWLQCTDYTPMNGIKEKKNGFKAAFAVGMAPSGMDLIVKVNDTVHCQKATNGNLWKSDSVQFALDTESKGRKSDRLEFQAGLGPNGAVIWKEKAPAIRGDLPSKYSHPDSVAQYSTIVVERKGNTTIYKIHVSKDDLYPYSYLKDAPLRFSLLVNNRDGKDREGYLHWADGIGSIKNPGLYGDLTILVPARTLISSNDMRWSWGAAKKELKADSIKITSSAADKKSAAAITSKSIPVVGGVSYLLSCKVRGNVAINIMATLSQGKNKKRFDVFERESVDSKEWKTLEKNFILPTGTDKIQPHIFCWNQNGWFEVKDFSLKQGNYGR